MFDDFHGGKRNTKSPGLFYSNELLYNYRNYNFDFHLNDHTFLGYSENEETTFNLYDQLPKKISFFKLFKYRKPIQNFILYQYHLNANTFAEKKLLKEVKTEVNLLYEKDQFKYSSMIGLCSILLTRNIIGWFVLVFAYALSVNSVVGDLIFFKRSNDIMMKFQINSFYKLGRETKDFVRYLNDNCDVKSLKYRKEKSYYDKFFVNFEDITFEKDDKLIDYLDPSCFNIKVNIHQELLETLKKQKDMKKN
jgi:hypothetical protein